jgi:hypothetical protein
MNTSAAAASGPVTVVATKHSGRDAYRISNDVVYALAVPSIARVMQFGFVGESSPVFWENDRARRGEWANYGGDKVWPAPQQEWSRITGRAWPPPAGFDQVAFTAEVRRESLRITSTVDPVFGIAVTRDIRLQPNQPVMTIETSFTKVSGDPVNVGIWTVTQLCDPVRVCGLGEPPVRAFRVVMGDPPDDLTCLGGIVSFGRPRDRNMKLESDGTSLLWMDHRFALRIDTRCHGPMAGASSTAIYTNQDPQTYVELETIGPVVKLVTGESLVQTNTYTLSRRTETDSYAEALHACGGMAREVAQ